MKPNRRRKKLALSRTRVRNLTPVQLDGVVGGALDTDLKCSSYSYFSAACDPSETMCTEHTAQKTC